MGAKNFYVDEESGDLVVCDDDKVVSNKYTTKFQLCSARCVRKSHFGTFDGKTFRCYFYDEETTEPVEMTAKQVKRIVLSKAYNRGRR